MHTHASLLAQADAAEHWLGVGEDERVWATADDGSGPSIWLMLAAWRRAASVVVVDLELDSDAKLELLDRLRPAAVWFSDDEYATLGAAAVPPWVDLRSIRRAFVDSNETEGASSFSTAFGAALVPVFALDELGVVAGWPAGREGHADAHTAQPAPGVQVAVVDEDGAELQPGEVGDVAVRSDAPTLFTGYAGREGRSRSAEWFRFGWRGALTAEGALRLEARSPGEVEPVGASVDLPIPEVAEEPEPTEPMPAEPVEQALPDEAEPEGGEVDVHEAEQTEDARLLAERQAREQAAAEAEGRRRAEEEAKGPEKAAAEAKQRGDEEKRREKERQREEKEARARAEREAKEREKAEAEERRRAEEQAKIQAKREAAEAKQRAKDDKEREQREARERAEREKREAEAAKVRQKQAEVEAKQRAEEEKRREKEREREEKEARRRAEQEAKEAARAEREAARKEKRRGAEEPKPADEGERRFGRRRRVTAEEPERQHVPDVVARIKQYGMAGASTEPPAEPPEQPDSE